MDEPRQNDKHETNDMISVFICADQTTQRPSSASIRQYRIFFWFRFDSKFIDICSSTLRNRFRSKIVATQSFVRFFAEHFVCLVYYLIWSVVQNKNKKKTFPFLSGLISFRNPHLLFALSPFVVWFDKIFQIQFISFWFFCVHISSNKRLRFCFRPSSEKMSRINVFWFGVLLLISFLFLFCCFDRCLVIANASTSIQHCQSVCQTFDSPVDFRVSSNWTNW